MTREFTEFLPPITILNIPANERPVLDPAKGQGPHDAIHPMSHRLTTVFVPGQDEASGAFGSRGNADTTTYGQAKPARTTPEKVLPTFRLPFTCQPTCSFSAFPVSAQRWG